MAWTRKAPPPRPFRNLVINGAMNVAQRATSKASITGSGYYTADRWNINTAGTTLGTWTQSVESDGPSDTFLKKSLKMLCTTAKASPSTGDLIQIEQRLEGQNAQVLMKGTSGAQNITVSFWVKSNVTGTYICRFYDNDNTRGCGRTYTISSSGTWEKKTLTFPGDTSGALDNDQYDSLRLVFQLAVGSSFSSGSFQSTWGAYDTSGAAVGQTNLASATNNYWQITGVQMETGSSASDFEYIPYADELAKCKRYYYAHRQQVYFDGSSGNGDVARGAIVFPATMRGTPAITVYPDGNLSSNPGQAYISNTNALSSSGVTTATGSPYGFDSITRSGGLGGAYQYGIGFSADAEL